MTQAGHKKANKDEVAEFNDMRKQLSHPKCAQWGSEGNPKIEDSYHPVHMSQEERRKQGERCQNQQY